jgi:hypothetical protein
VDAAEQRRLAQQNQDYSTRKAAEEQLRQQRAEAYWDEVHREREKQHNEVVENIAKYKARDLYKEAIQRLEDAASRGHTRTGVGTEWEQSDTAYGEGNKIAVNAVAEALRQKGYTVRVEESRSSETKGESHGSYWSSGHTVPTSKHTIIISSDPSDT